MISLKAKIKFSGWFKFQISHLSYVHQWDQVNDIRSGDKPLLWTKSLVRGRVCSTPDAIVPSLQKRWYKCANWPDEHRSYCPLDLNMFVLPISCTLAAVRCEIDIYLASERKILGHESLTKVYHSFFSVCYVKVMITGIPNYSFIFGNAISCIYVIYWYPIIIIAKPNPDLHISIRMTIDIGFGE